jgi:hypothetical protein
MFERTRVDTASQQQQVRIPVQITYTDGRIAKGKLITTVSRPVSELLNAPGGFIEFEPYGEEKSFVAKSALYAVKLVNVPSASGLQARSRDVDSFDPFAVLGLANGATWDEVRQAYHRLAKLYHPDRYSSVELPPEVRDYLSAMARRVNAAFAAIEEPVVAQKVAADRPAPVYTSPTRT